MLPYIAYMDPMGQGFSFMGWVIDDFGTDSFGPRESGPVNPRGRRAGPVFCCSQQV